MRTAFFIALILAGLRCAYPQQAASPIEQARLFRELPMATNRELETNDPFLGDDDSFGEQVILQSQPRTPTLVITGDTSVFYTNNVALTPNNRIDDVFFASNAGVSWTPQVAPRLKAQIAAHSSIFRYDKTSALDFQGL